MSVSLQASPASRAILPFHEFVTLMAALMALNALAIDIMLPALPEIGAALGVARANDSQLVMSVYMFGVGMGAFVFGPLADRFGRRAVLLVGLGGYGVLALGCAVADNFEILLATRLAQGVFASSAFVLAITIIRDCYQGDAMARLSSLAGITFMIVPVVAPTVGQAILTFAGWREIFWALTAFGTMVWIWVALRLPETLRPENRQALSARRIGSIWLRVIRHRQARAYMLASGVFFGALFGYVNCAQQIFSDIFGRRDAFPYIFALIAGSMALTSWINSRLVMRFGARAISHRALMFYIAIAVVQLVVANHLAGNFPLALAGLTLTISMVGFVGANFGALAMEPFGDVAGSASSLQSSVRVIIGAVVGGVIGGAFDGTLEPLFIGLSLCGILSLLLVLRAGPGTQSPDQVRADDLADKQA